MSGRRELVDRCSTFVIKSNFWPAIEALHFFNATGTKLKRKSPARKSETSKQVLEEATLLIWAPVAALVAVASNVGPIGIERGIIDRAIKAYQVHLYQEEEA